MLKRPVWSLVLVETEQTETSGWLSQIENKQKNQQKKQAAQLVLFEWQGSQQNKKKDRKKTTEDKASTDGECPWFHLFTTPGNWGKVTRVR